jgi:hypothetical protein
VSDQGVRLVLELERNDPINGRAFRDERLIGSFTGWMELYSAIERARLEGTRRAPARTESPTDETRGG